MQSNSILISNYSNPEIEAHINNMEQEVNDFATLQAKEDAEKDNIISESIYKIKFLEPLHSKVQAGIDLVRQILLPASRINDANEAEAKAAKRLRVITNESNDKKQMRMSLFRKLNNMAPDPLKIKYARWFLPASILFGGADGCVAYSNFRAGSYTPLLAFFTALAIALAISFSHIPITPWLAKSVTERQRINRIFIILSAAFVFFLLISTLRAGAASNTADIAIEGSTVSAPKSSSINGLPIALASFGLFALVLFLALRFWMSKKERQEVEEYSRLSGEIEKLDSEIEKMADEKKKIEEALLQQKSEVRRVFDYAVNSIRRCRNIAGNGISMYKRVYARFRNDQVPDFFAEPAGLSFDDSFQFFNVQKPETV